MSWTVSQSSAGQSYAAGTQTTFVTDTNNATFVLCFDLTNMTTGDCFALRCFAASSTSTTPVQVWKGTWQHVQINPAKFSPPIPSNSVFKATFESIAGSTSSTFPWQLLRI